MSALPHWAPDAVQAALAPDSAAPIGQWLRARLAGDARLVADSREVRPGDAFFAYPGHHTDGRAFISDALARGAAVVLHEAGDTPDRALPGEVTHLGVTGLRDLAGPIAAQFHGRSVDRLRIAAVTGTNGKTSVSHWIAGGLSNLGVASAIVGTLGGGQIEAAGPTRYETTGLTTPDALDLQRMLDAFARRSVRRVVMEASSIGLDQGRLNGTPIEVAVFTNLSRDHLDYHASMADYEAAKARLFAWPGLRAAVVNGDDPASVAMLAAIAHSPVAAPIQRIIYGFSPGQHGARGDRLLMADRIHEDAQGITVELAGDYGRADVRLSLLGRFNVANALAVAGTWLAFGMPFEQVLESLEHLQPVTGRMQRIDSGEGPMVVIDYAHSPDALANTLEALRPVAHARNGLLWCVFGAGGERDPGKRPMMGYLAQRGADRLVITSDNPRGEEPFRIVSDIRAGLSREPFATELDRGRAIGLALAAADPQDIVLVAGKGHEDYQEIRGERRPFSDAAVVRAALAARPPQERLDV